MSESHEKRNIEENPQPAIEVPLPKVRLVTQPRFGHELRRAQQTIADLFGQVAQLEWATRAAEQYADSLESDLEDLERERDELNEEVKSLQVSDRCCTDND
ncbi:hypothetical protein K435DRAFT_879509 [Dendrothele bispora CBS 962.96]|uniref:Uncharacterized protein n=1 Tax=Dendrothele bispora (strain CBS 962.96) TaxID=1314807 RepID=A0A4S8KL87_DENBC|nr:hypothetical protein K435DRAFT_879509 [Dendrothele bispora CBS 962.96]